MLILPRADIGADERIGLLAISDPTVIRVSTSGNDANNGSAWSGTPPNGPMKTIQAAANRGASEPHGVEIWVKAGTYLESLTITNSYVTLFAGFAGTETSRDQRDWANNVTIIDGGQTGRVVRFLSSGSRANALDGFKIAGGNIAGVGGGVMIDNAGPEIQNCAIVSNRAQFGGGIYGNSANGAIVSNCWIVQNVTTGNPAFGELWPNSAGGGVCFKLSSVSIRNSRFFGNETVNDGVGGAAIFMHLDDVADGAVSPLAVATVRDCVIASNKSDYVAGGISCYGYNNAWPKQTYVVNISDTIIRTNVAGYGGGFHNWSWSVVPSLTNCLFDSNVAINEGSAVKLMRTDYADPYTAVTSLKNCTFIGNINPADYVVHVDESPLTISDCIIWSNRASGPLSIAGYSSITSLVQYSCIEGGYSGIGAGSGLLAVDPLLTDVPNGAVYLSRGSRCADAGSATAASMGLAWTSGYGTDPDQDSGDSGVVDIGYHYRGYTANSDSDDDLLPDWWELQYYGNTTGNAGDDSDADGLESREEYYYRYSPLVSERTLYHSPFKTVQVNTNDPADADDGSERLDFSGLGRPLSLASNGADWAAVGLDGDGKLGSGIYLNNDASNLYIGISGLEVNSNNVFALFIDAQAGGETSLAHLAVSTPPFGFSQTRNLRFDAAQFTPEVGLLLGGRYADGKNCTNYVFPAIGAAWGLYAANGQTSTATRAFSAPLQTGQTFVIEMDNGNIDSGREVGFALRDNQNTARFRFLYRGFSTDSYKILDAAGERDLNPAMGWTYQGIRVEFTLTATNTYSARIVRKVTGQVTVTNGTLTGTANSLIDRVILFNNGAGSGSGSDAYFNNIMINGIAYDTASDKVYRNGGWNSGGGFGFGAWSFFNTEGGSAGRFSGSSVNNGPGGTINDIDGPCTNDAGQGVYYLSNNGHFSGFSAGSGAISQWGTNFSGDTVSAQEGIEIALSLSALGTSPTGIIKVAGVFMGFSDGTNRLISREAYGNRIVGGVYSTTILIGAEVQLTAAGHALPPSVYPGFTDDDVMFQAFYWNVPSGGTWYDLIRTQLSDIAHAGFTRVWLPVPTKADNPAFSMGYAPADHYDLGEYSYQGTVKTLFGSRTELTNLIAAIVASNLMPICDIVLNHMGGGTNSANYKSFQYSHGTFFKTNTDFHPSVLAHNDELNPYHNNYGFGGEGAHPQDVAFLSQNMRLGLKRWGNWLVASNGYRGWRLDFTEGVEPWYNYEWLNYPGQRPYFAFMEYWKNADGRQQQEWLDLTGRKAAIYDWNLQIIMEQMEEQGGSFDMNRLKSPSLLGREPSYCATFVENHDTLQPSDSWGVTNDKHMGYAYIMHSKGLPQVFYRDYYLAPYYNGTTHVGVPLKPRIDRLIKIRKATVGGEVQYLSTNDNLFIQQRDGGGTKPGSVLVINDHATLNSNLQVKTQWSSTWLIDLVTTNPATLVLTAGDGTVTLGVPPRDYRIYGLTNTIPQLE